MKPQVYVRAAALRAAILAYLNAHPEGATTTELVNKVNVEPQFYEPDPSKRRAAISCQMITLRNHETATGEFEGREVRYFLAKQIKRKDVVPSSPQPQIQATKNERRMADVQVEIVKSTGRVRIGVHGLVIEIGVVDK